MNEKIDLTKILKDCPKGTKLYSIAWGYVMFEEIICGCHPIVVRIDRYHVECFSDDGKMFAGFDGECALFPSKYQRDWSKFTAPWLKKDKFDPKTLKPFDKVLVRYSSETNWSCDLFSHIVKNGPTYPYMCVSSTFKHCIPYNDKTKHLVGTNEDAPEFFRYWEE